MPSAHDYMTYFSDTYFNIIRYTFIYLPDQTEQTHSFSRDTFQYIVYVNIKSFISWILSAGYGFHM